MLNLVQWMDESSDVAKRMLLSAFNSRYSMQVVLACLQCSASQLCEIDRQFVCVIVPRHSLPTTRMRT